MASNIGNFGLALGGGGARGLAHIKILQVLDEMNLRPTKIAGTSMGALIGSLYAAGMSGLEIEEFARELFSKRTSFFKRIHKYQPKNFTRLFNFTTPAIINSVSFFELIMQEKLPETFAELEIPFFVSTADFHTQTEYVISQGPIMPAIAASSTLPALLKPVELDGRVLIDGGFVNPVPYNLLTKDLDITIGVDVTGEPPHEDNKVPNSVDALIGASQIMLRSLTNAVIKLDPPSILVQPMVGRYNVLDYFKMDEIFKDTSPAIEKFQRDLDQILTIDA